MRAGLVNRAEAELKHLENRPNLPKSYRLDNLAQTLRVRSIGALWFCIPIPWFDPSRLPVKSGFDQVRGTGKLNLVKTPFFDSTACAVHVDCR